VALLLYGGYFWGYYLVSFRSAYFARTIANWAGAGRHKHNFAAFHILRENHACTVAISASSFYGFYFFGLA
jgi:hypothetical protein